MVLDCIVPTDFSGTVLFLSGDFNEISIRCRKESDQGRGNRTGIAVEIVGDNTRKATFNIVDVIEAHYFGTVLKMYRTNKWCNQNLFKHILGYKCDVVLDMEMIDLGLDGNIFVNLFGETCLSPCYYIDGRRNFFGRISWSGGGGIEFRNTSENNYVCFVNGVLTAVTDNGVGNRIEYGGDPAYHTVSKNSGVAIFSGDGATSDFLIGEHGLFTNPTDPSRIHITVTPASPDAIEASPCIGYASDENGDGKYESIRVKFTKAPVSGTNNVKVAWKAELEFKS